MEFSIKSLQPGRTRSGCAVVGVFESRKLAGASAQLDEATQGALSSIVKRGDSDGKSGTTLMLHNLAGIAAERVLLVGLGREAEFGQRQYREAIAAAMRALSSSGAKDAEFHLTALALD
ncbi:MAG: hypothetical protein JWM26_2238, partial [Betaproteobacteria bacterium]|nr:hypothetical protein [Betaproteobacteria bacterium]